jgi:hypothetical protein
VFHSLWKVAIAPVPPTDDNMLNIQLTQLAPAVVIFFNQAWMDIGTKRSLVELVSEITGIQDLFD